MRRTVAGLLRERRHDVVHVQMARMAALLDGTDAPPRVVDLIDALSLNMARRHALDHGPTRWLAGIEQARLVRARAPALPDLGPRAGRVRGRPAGDRRLSRAWW